MSEDCRRYREWLPTHTAGAVTGPSRKTHGHRRQSRRAEERHHGTHQDRLIKKMRLRGIVDYDTVVRKPCVRKPC